jgi:hypothetical protein
MNVSNCGGSHLALSPEGAVRLALGRCVPQPPRRPPVVPYSLPPLAYGVRPSNHCAPTRVGAWSRIAVPPFSSAPPRWSSPSVDAQPARSSRGRRWLWDLVAAPPPGGGAPPPPPRAFALGAMPTAGCNRWCIYGGRVLWLFRCCGA